MKDYLYIPQACCSYKPPVPATHITRGRNTPRPQGPRLGEFKEKGKTKNGVQKEFDVNATEDTHKGRIFEDIWKHKLQHAKALLLHCRMPILAPSEHPYFCQVLSVFHRNTGDQAQQWGSWDDVKMGIIKLCWLENRIVEWFKGKLKII